MSIEKKTAPIVDCEVVNIYGSYNEENTKSVQLYVSIHEHSRHNPRVTPTLSPINPFDIYAIYWPVGRRADRIFAFFFPHIRVYLPPVQ